MKIPDPKLLQDTKWLYPITKNNPIEEGICIAHHPITEFVFAHGDRGNKEREV